MKNIIVLMDLTVNWHIKWICVDEYRVSRNYNSEISVEKFEEYKNVYLRYMVNNFYNICAIEYSNIYLRIKYF